MAADRLLRVVAALACAMVMASAFKYDNVTHTLQEPLSFLHPDLHGSPFPTGAFWTNFVLGQRNEVVVTYPYAVKLVNDQLHISYPFRVVTAKSIIQGFTPEIVVQLGPQPLQIRRFDDLSVTIAFPQATGGTIILHLVRGSPYMTLEYQDATPAISSAANILSVAPSSPTSPYSQVTLGNWHQWLLFTSTPFAWTQHEHTWSGPRRFNGIVRIALALHENAKSILAAHAAVYPTGASISYDLQSAFAEDSYNFGKQFGREARLVLTAHRFNHTNVFAKGLAKLQSQILSWLQGMNVDHFVYDTAYGGLITAHGFRSDGEDYGNGNYNDHHYARLLLAMEIRSTQLYWHIPAAQSPPIYEPAFAANKMVGVVSEMDVVYSTWFGDRPAFIHGIQVIPVTPITASLLPYATCHNEPLCGRLGLECCGAPDGCCHDAPGQPQLECCSPPYTKNETPRKVVVGDSASTCDLNPRCWTAGPNGAALACCTDDTAGCCPGHACCNAPTGWTFDRILLVVLGVLAVLGVVYCSVLYLRRKDYRPLERDIRAWYCGGFMVVMLGVFFYLAFTVQN
ncbi:hypothetical protein DYB37_008409 [Aphanomyces astaci]|uniref:glucan endo-1,3-beta-D-glucosidase n=1 Tax=Aphanomyces astaci TaxID=112090 RepID=A0A418ELB7_APHAT|nr:hypothetical protein DYB37_008409 [Aphanomyces astaci]